MTTLEQLHASLHQWSVNSLDPGKISHASKFETPCDANAPTYPVEEPAAFASNLANLDGAKNKLSQVHDNVSAAQTKAKGELDQKIENAKAGFAGKQDEARAAKDRLRGKIDRHKADDDANKAARHADDAAEYAAYCIDYAAVSIDEADYAVLRAVEARVTADELNG